MPERTFQEDLLIVESLVEYNANWYDANPHRAGRAYQLADEIAGRYGLSIKAALLHRQRLEGR